MAPDDEGGEPAKPWFRGRVLVASAVRRVGAAAFYDASCIGLPMQLAGACTTLSI
jgi:hypothetical protein